ncbi:MAG TPA: hypothetical protein VIO60_09150, partial [Rectinemataceae bacterium]
YAHSNQAFDLESDWVRGFESRKPLARISLDFSLKDFLYLYCDMQYGRNRFNLADDLFYALARYPGGIGAIIGPGDTSAVLAWHSAIYSAPFLTNILLEPRDFDYQWPKRAVASIGGPNWNLSLARDRLRWGNGHSGNFVVDDHSDYQDFARLSAFSDNFKYEWLLVFLESSPAQGEVAEEKFRTLFAHRLEFRILKRISFAISENILYQNDVFDLKYLNPAFIYHNLNKRNMFNAIAHAELDWNFARGWKLYAQGVMDQGRAPTESSIQADATGWLAGLEYAGAAGAGLVTSSLEFALTSPLLYRRDGLDFIAYRKYYTNGDPTSPNYGYAGFIVNLDYLGYQYGGDAIILQWDGAYRVPGLGKASVRLFGMRHGEMDFYLSHNKDGVNAGFADYEGTTPSGGVVDEMLAASLLVEGELPKVTAWIKPRFWLELGWVGRGTYTKSTGSRGGFEFDFQATAGVSISL